MFGDLGMRILVGRGEGVIGVFRWFVSEERHVWGVLLRNI